MDTITQPMSSLANGYVSPEQHRLSSKRPYYPRCRRRLFIAFKTKAALTKAGFEVPGPASSPDRWNDGFGSSNTTGICQMSRPKSARGRLSPELTTSARTPGTIFVIGRRLPMTIGDRL
ncbi:hypothetical protein JNB91_27910 [Rhizobium wenxiniae]|uniref:hypothetical protein n=1 Tax=Rhizobium wenxiniae TaxID=1737357 RepID=UPI001C6F1EDE|nr:hypothetical protein [Rhizobium wenxiniae]MBW9091626.1 hypothetical protein [Rhizobium wenxiniae]